MDFIYCLRKAAAVGESAKGDLQFSRFMLMWFLLHPHVYGSYDCRLAMLALWILWQLDCWLSVWAKRPKLLIGTDLVIYILFPGKSWWLLEQSFFQLSCFSFKLFWIVITWNSIIHILKELDNDIVVVSPALAFVYL
jgi:hypothetical protein